MTSLALFEWQACLRQHGEEGAHPRFQHWLLHGRETNHYGDLVEYCVDIAKTRIPALEKHIIDHAGYPKVWDYYSKFMYGHRCIELETMIDRDTNSGQYELLADAREELYKKYLNAISNNVEDYERKIEI